MPDTTNPTPEEQKAIDEQKDALLVSQQARIAQLEADLKAQASEPKAARPTASETFKFGNKEYRIVHSVMLKKDDGLVKLTPAEIVKDKEVREMLVKNKSTAVEEV